MTGLLAALGAAFFWTLATSIWREQTKSISSIQLNGTKNLIATLLFLPVLIFLPWEIEWGSICLLFLSGIIGISFGDTFYFASLQILGTRRTLTIEALAPLMATILGFIFLGEGLSIRSWIGISLVSVAVIIVSRQTGTRHNFCTEYSQKYLQLKGIGLALLSVISGVFGGLLSRIVLTNSELLPLQTSSIRILGSLFLYFPLLICMKRRLTCFKRIAFVDIRKILIATLLGTNLGVFLQQISFHRLPLGLAVTLLSTSPLLALLFAHREGDYPGSAGLVAAAISVLGVGLAMS